jgi:hypothetical protein
MVLMVGVGKIMSGLVSPSTLLFFLAVVVNVTSFYLPRSQRADLVHDPLGIGVGRVSAKN